MKDNYTDLRIIRTKESIREALVELIEEKGFEAITVKDITTRARINRGTFYAHYENKFDLITKLEDEFMHNIAQITKQNIKNDSDTVEVDLPIILETAVFEYLNERSDFLNAILGPKGNLTFQTRLRDFMLKIMFGEQSPLIKEEELLVSKHYLAAYVASAHIGVIQKWLETGRRESPQEIAQFLANITVNGTFNAAGLNSKVKK
ncbi:TetR/AcrR family transcriptional regulator [Heyndrickxia vini]|uniref:TetR/AcrR family transcriptional regulator n=1 Tax=Heyndrickxia vini TaxID=1476025 RepID=A0ABX7EAH1_9BACI|nr:TetR/AcrR family transcriptional regulator [Heyndrickxia vini]QQZ11512.1 TetR/AcrR family transcriptional regulator [Heyndrickxia vini]